ncbi:uncharacterized protein LOC143256123 isoform X3 [Tachypleus tridentatus]|uniref:uncharacterized protein LOC143256123 isoform X3 n=1 Tax=Tachypleus tridentatus TaxID=6853 RepID=UPI003FCFCC30
MTMDKKILRERCITLPILSSVEGLLKYSWAEKGERSRQEEKYIFSIKKESTRQEEVGRNRPKTAQTVNIKQ